MNVKKTVKKILALGAGATMVGATVFGALAYNLEDYPSKIVEDGFADVKIVFGADAETSDVMGAVDIAASIQAMSVSKEPVTVPGQTGKVSLTGDNFKIETSADQLELREPIGDVVDTITEDDLSGLKSGHISTSEGDTDFFQYLRFKDGANLQEMGVNYVENDDNDLGDYLVIDADLPFIEWEIQFPEGLESELNDATAAVAGDLDDLDDKAFNILGTDFTIVSAGVQLDGQSFTMTLMGGSIADTLGETETKVYSLNGVEYEVMLVFVSDPNTDGGANEAKFMVNGEVTSALEEGETEMLSGGIQIGVRDLLVNSRDGVASFFLGADKVEITDPTTDGSATFDGTIKINQERINDGDIEVLGGFTDSSNETFEITSMKYRLTMDAESGSIAYLPSGEGVRQHMDKPEALISESLDLKYEGLEEVPTTDVVFDSHGDDQYEMTFTNINGQEYTFPLVSNDGGTWKLGDEDYNLVFVEGGDATDYTIARRDYFIVSNVRDDRYKSITNVLRYEDYDSSSRTLEFEDLASGTTHKVTVTASPGSTGSLLVGGHSYSVYVNESTAREPTIGIDLDASGNWDDLVSVTAWGGLVIDLNHSADFDAGNVLNTVTEWQTLLNNSGVFNTLNSSGNFTDNDSEQFWLKATVDSSLFDTSTADETFTWYVSRATSNEADLSFDSGSVTGPFATAGTDEFEAFDWTDLPDDDDRQAGMTDYGIYVEEYNPSGSDPNELIFRVPKQQVLPQVFVTLGEVEAVAGGAGVIADRVNPTSVGLAMLDETAPAIGTANMIVVGGPCVNTVAAELMGSPADCTAGFTPGKALIKAYESNDKVAILVAGYGAQDTTGAAYVLASYEDYTAFQGTEVEVVVPDLSNIVVQAVTAAPVAPVVEDEEEPAE